MKKLELLLFDMDNTLYPADPESAEKKLIIIAKYFWENIGLRKDFPHLDNKKEGQMLEFYRTLVRNAGSNSALFSKHGLDPGMIDNITLEFLEDEGGLKYISQKRNLELLETFDYLKSREYLLGVYSNADRYIISLTLNHLGIGEKHRRKFFKNGAKRDLLIVSGVDGKGYKRPELKGFEHILERTNLYRRGIVFIGDEEKKDIAPARIKGLRTGLVTWLDERVETTADCQMRDVYILRNVSIEELLLCKYINPSKIKPARDLSGYSETYKR